MSKHYFVMGDAVSLDRWGTEALEAGQQVGVNRMQLLALRQLATVALMRDDISTADTIIQQAVQLCDQNQIVDLRHNLYGVLGSIAELKGDLDMAAQWYTQARDVFKQRDDLPSLSTQLLRLGRVNTAMHNDLRARLYYDEALQVALECGRADNIGLALFSLAQLDLDDNHLNESTGKAQQAIDLFRRLGMKREKAEAETLLAKLTDGSPSS